MEGGPPSRTILVDIEALYESDTEALKRYKEKFGGKDKLASDMTHYPLKENFCATQAKQFEEILTEVCTMLVVCC
jgi:hypothetical protein